MSTTTPVKNAVQKKDTSPEQPVRIIKVASCKTLSGKSNLTYHLGAVDKDIYFRVYSNDGGGFFSTEWVAMKDIDTALKKATKDNPITSIMLYRLFKGKSVNTPAFLLAALKHEQIVQPIKGKKRTHELMDVKGFLSKANKLIASTVSLKPTDKPKRVATKAPIKKRIAANTIKKSSSTRR